MFLFDCKKLRLVVLVALVLFAFGLVLQIPRMVAEDLGSLATLLSGIGLLSVVASPVLMVSAALLSLFPGISRRLALCEH